MIKISFSPLAFFPSSLELLLAINPRMSKTKAKKFLKAYGIKERSWEAQKTIYWPITLINEGLISPIYEGEACSIIFENEYFIAVCKKHKTHSQPLDYSCQKNVLSYLLSINKFQAVMVNKSHYDRGLLHRLDYETSGVLVLGKTEKAHREMREKFKQKVEAKKYLALVKGDMSFGLGLHTHPIKPSERKGQKMVLGDDHSPLASLKIIKVHFHESHHCSLVEILLKTGHRHQIRFQLAELGFPIIGDELYGGEKYSYLLLHSCEYIFEYKGQKVIINSGTPVKIMTYLTS